MAELRLAELCAELSVDRLEELTHDELSDCYQKVLAVYNGEKVDAITELRVTSCIRRIAVEVMLR